MRLSFVLFLALVFGVAQARPAGYVFSTKDWKVNPYNSGGVYLLTSHKANGKDVYVNEVEKRFLFWGGWAWTITSTIYWDEVLEDPYGKGGFHFSYESEATRGWNDYTVIPVDQAEVFLGGSENSALREYHGTYHIISGVINGKEVYSKSDEDGHPTHFIAAIEETPLRWGVLPAGFGSIHLNPPQERRTTDDQLTSWNGFVGFPVAYTPVL